ncbi:MAG TPA: sulfatase-like hydrolase/transferase [Nitrospiraceae bacterium]|nr:sulfatase-like hydrolase/transferase [Nitrospiraceae bacterium]
MKRRLAKQIKASHWALAVIALLLLYGCTATKPTRTVAGTPGSPPNILFIIMDDVGIDQMKLFGYGGVTPPKTPNIDAIARAGVRFRNVWDAGMLTEPCGLFRRALPAPHQRAQRNFEHRPGQLSSLAV